MPPPGNLAPSLCAALPAWRIHAHVTIAVLALLVERIAEIRAGDTWRNLADQLDRIKVVEYEHNGARIRQTSHIDRELTGLLAKLGVPLPPKLHAVAPAPPAA